MFQQFQHLIYKDEVLSVTLLSCPSTNCSFWSFWFPLPIPGTELVTLFLYGMLLLLPLDLLCPFCLLSRWHVCKTRLPVSTAVTSIGSILIWSPGPDHSFLKIFLPSSPVHSSRSQHDHSSLICFTWTLLCRCSPQRFLHFVRCNTRGLSLHQSDQTPK